MQIAVEFHFKHQEFVHTFLKIDRLLVRAQVYVDLAEIDLYSYDG